jgi:hypothetical protein
MWWAEEFHQWSFASHEDKMPDKRVWSSYKMPLKQFIKDFNGDSEYFASKTKVISVHNGCGNELGIDSNFQPVRFGAHSVSLQRMEEKYGRNGLARYRSALPGEKGSRGDTQQGQDNIIDNTMQSKYDLQSGARETERLLAQAAQQQSRHITDSKFVST